MIKKICQSCGKELTKENRGSELNNGFSEIYCNYCFDNGEFRENINLEEMQNRVRLSLVKTPMPKYVKDNIVSNIKKLKRWTNK